jgi:hypothetical protein
LKEAKVLHIAPENTAGVPYSMMDMQNQSGFKSRLITFYKIPFDFPEDICLDLKLPRGRLAMKWRSIKHSMLHNKIKEQKINQYSHMPYFAPGNLLEKFYMNLREGKNENKLLKALEDIDVESFGIIHFDGGIDFFRDSRLAKKWKKEGKKILNCYFGDDLRTRGVVKEMDELSDLNLTFEYDHTLRHPDINFLFFPFDNSRIRYISDEIYNRDETIRVIHSPTNRAVKGTHSVINAVEKVKKLRKIEFILVENTPREELITIKSTCHIAIDQIGNRGGTGYGINSLETLSMGIPTVTDMNCGMDTWLPENPFIVADENTLAEKLIELIDDKSYRMKKRAESRKWVEKYHSYQSVFAKLNKIYKSHNII